MGVRLIRASLRRVRGSSCSVVSSAVMSAAMPVSAGVLFADFARVNAG